VQETAAPSKDAWGGIYVKANARQTYRRASLTHRHDPHDTPRRCRRNCRSCQSYAPNHVGIPNEIGSARIAKACTAGGVIIRKQQREIAHVTGHIDLDQLWVCYHPLTNGNILPRSRVRETRLETVSDGGKGNVLLSALSFQAIQLIQLGQSTILGHNLRCAQHDHASRKGKRHWDCIEDACRFFHPHRPCKGNPLPPPELLRCRHPVSTQRSKQTSPNPFRFR